MEGFRAKMKGKHRAPSNLGRNVAKTGTLALAIPVLTMAYGGVAEASEPGTSILETIAQCESGNQNISTRGRSTASGFFQILDSTWRSFGGQQFATRAIHASREEQLTVAQRILAGQGIGAWNPSRSCWSKKITVAQPHVARIVPKTSTPTTPRQKKATPQPAKVSQKKVTTRTRARTVAESYLIRPGDTLWHISRTHKTTVRRLVELNRDTVKNPNRIYAGNHLRLG